MIDISSNASMLMRLQPPDTNFRASKRVIKHQHSVVHGRITKAALLGPSAKSGIGNCSGPILTRNE